MNYFKAHDVVDPAPLGRAVLFEAEEPTESPDSTDPTEDSTAPDESPESSEEATDDATDSPQSSEEATQSADSSEKPQSEQKDDSKDQNTENLADTGFNASWIGIIAGAVVLIGIALLLIRRFGNKAGR